MPDGLGILTLAQAIASTLIVLVSFGLNQLLVRDVAIQRTRAQSYVSNAASIKLSISVLYVVLLFLVVRTGSYAHDVAIIIYLYGINALISEFTGTLLSIFRAFERMEFNLFTRLLRDVTNVTFSLLAISLHCSLTVIVTISVISSLAELLLATFLLRRQLVTLRPAVDIRLCKQVLVSALPFAVLSFIPLTSSQLNTLILSGTHGFEDVGLFSAANNITGIFMLIPTIYMQAVFPVFSRLSASSHEALQLSYRKSFNYLLLCGLALSFGTFLTAPQIIAFLFGAGYQRASDVLRILGWLPLFGFVGYCNGHLLCAIGREKLFMLTEGIAAVLCVVLAFLLTTRYGYMGAACAMTLPPMLGLVGYSVLCHRLVGVPLPWRFINSAVGSALVMAGGIYASLHFGVHLLVIVLLIAPAIYGGSLYLSGAISGEDVVLLRQALPHAEVTR